MSYPDDTLNREKILIACKDGKLIKGFDKSEIYDVFSMYL